MFVFAHFLIEQKNIFVDAEKRKRAVKSTLYLTFRIPTLTRPGRVPKSSFSILYIF